MSEFNFNRWSDARLLEMEREYYRQARTAERSTYGGFHDGYAVAARRWAEVKGEIKKRNLVLQAHREK